MTTLLVLLECFELSTSNVYDSVKTRLVCTRELANFDFFYTICTNYTSLWPGPNPGILCTVFHLLCSFLYRKASLDIEPFFLRLDRGYGLTIFDFVSECTKSGDEDYSLTMVRIPVNLLGRKYWRFCFSEI